MNRSSTLAALIFSAPLFTACGISQPPDLGDTTPVTPVTPVAPKVRFLAFGDAGRANDNQNAVGAAMAQLCALKGCDFALELGDNFYDAGVSSTADEQWQSKFETPYKALNIPIYATLGNHDNSSALGAQIGAGEGSSNARGNFQVDYTNLAGTSGKWKMPARYHAFTAPLAASAADTPIIEFFCLDSSPLAATLADPSPAYNAATYGPTQLQWFQSAILASKAKWTVAFAHHPYVSNGTHGNAGEFEGLPSTSTGPLPIGLPFTANGQPWKDFLDQSLCAMNVDFFMFGHDHLLEWLKPVATCNAKTEFILSGGGSDVREFKDATLNPTYWQKDLAQGFFWFEVSATELKGESYFFTDGKLPLDAAGQPAPAFTRTVSK